MNSGRKLGTKSITILKTLARVGGTMARDLLESLGGLLPGERVGMSGGRVYYKQTYNLKRSGYVKIIRGKNNQSFFHLTPKSSPFSNTCIWKNSSLRSGTAAGAY
jgi:hypothetical protein